MTKEQNNLTYRIRYEQECRDMVAKAMGLPSLKDMLEGK